MTKNKNHANLHILHKNDFGFIGKCPCCKEIQFGIGNVVSFMPQNSFFALYRSLKRIDNNLEDSLTQLPNGEKVMLRTPVDNFILCLTLKEFKQVMDLFNQARMKLQLLKPLEEFEKMN